MDVKILDVCTNVQVTSKFHFEVVACQAWWSTSVRSAPRKLRQEEVGRRPVRPHSKTSQRRANKMNFLQAGWFE